jgi:hypothetical protein
MKLHFTTLNVWCSSKPYSFQRSIDILIKDNWFKANVRSIEYIKANPRILERFVGHDCFAQPINVTLIDNPSINRRSFNVS